MTSSRLTLVATAAVAGASLAGCVTTDAPPRTRTATSAPSQLADPGKPPARPHVVKVSPTAYGVALTDPRGFALYRFTRDKQAASTCYGPCAVAWPPYLVPTGQARRAEARDRLVATTRRSDGRLQVTFAGHPLYYYVGDRHPRQVLCQGVVEFGGGWYVVAPDGQLIP